MVINFSRWWFTKIRYRRSYKKAIKRAKHVKSTTGLKCYVLLFPGGYKAITKQATKLLMSSNKKYFKKGTTIQTIEQMAVYVTN